MDYWLTDMINVLGNLAYIDGKDGNYINNLSPLNGSVGVRLEQEEVELQHGVALCRRHGEGAQGCQGITSM